jgi:MYXO-CTERM domain-containing protein
MSPVHLLLALASVTEPVDALDDPSTAIPIDGGLMPTGELRDEPRTQQLGAKVLFVNFDGAQMNFCGNNDPAGDCSTIFQGVVLPYSGDAVKRASVIQVLRQRVADFGVSVTDLRPDSGPYDMEMVGNWQGEQPMFAGVAPNIDCFDNDGPEVSFTLESANTPDGIAEVVWQEAAHTWGLEHVDDPTDLLYPTTSGSNKQFRDTCSKIVEDTMLNPSSGYCNQMHTQFCDSGWQNSYQELLELFGESIPDTIAPTIEITSPADGDVIVGDFYLDVSFADDQHPVVIAATITLLQDGEPLSEPEPGSYAGPSELSFPINGLPPGDYTILVEGTDESDNPASDMIAITIDEPTSDESGGGTTGGGDDDDDGADSTDDAGDDDDGDDDDGSEGSDTGDPGETSTDRGCACRSTASPTTSFALGLFVLALARRRRAPR